MASYQFPIYPRTALACPAAREELAYHAQAQWLAFFGADLFQEFELDPITLKLTTACLPY